MPFRSCDFCRSHRHHRRRLGPARRSGGRAATVIARESLLEIAPALSRAAAAALFADRRRVQLRDVLSPASANAIRDLLSRTTPWGLAWGAGDAPPQGLRREQIAAMPPPEQQKIQQALTAAIRTGGYAFAFSQYRLLDAYLQRWAPGSLHEALLEQINGAPFLDLVREVTGLPSLIKADAQATLYAPGHFLGQHSDSHVGQGWLVAYVLNLTTDDWRPDWGGHLQFFDDDGDVIEAWRPRFNSLNLFAVPQAHAVSVVHPMAPLGRYAITGWFRDR